MLHVVLYGRALVAMTVDQTEPCLVMAHVHVTEVKEGSEVEVFVQTLEQVTTGTLQVLTGVFTSGSHRGVTEIRLKLKVLNEL